MDTKAKETKNVQEMDPKTNLDAPPQTQRQTQACGGGGGGGGGARGGGGKGGGPWPVDENILEVRLWG